MVNPAIVGRTYPATEPYLVGREAVREFALATQTAPTAVAPVTFAVIVSQRAEAALLFDPDAGIDFAHLVHGEQKFIHRRPIVPGDELVGTLTVASVKTLGPNTMLTTTTEIVDGAGSLVSTAIASFVIREAK